MGSQPESKLSYKIMQELRKRGVFCFKVWGNDRMMAGLPDIIACVEGEFVGYETKMPGEEDDVSPKQAHVHAQIRAANGRVFVVTSVAEAIEAMLEVRRFHNR